MGEEKMDENNKRIDELLGEDEANGHSARDISQKANQQAQVLLEQLRRSAAPAPTAGQEEADAFLAALTARRAKRNAARQAQAENRENRAPEEEITAPAAQESAQVSEADGEPKRKSAPIPAPLPKDITVAPPVSDIPQQKKKHRSVEEVLEALEEESDDKIERALAHSTETEQKRKTSLTRTGVIRKADALIRGETPGDSVKKEAPGAERTGTLHKTQEIVGERADVQTRAYSEYIRARERKKQDTGIIRSTDIQRGDTRAMPPRRTEADSPTIVIPSAGGVKLPLVDEETEIEKTIVRSSGRVISPLQHTGNIDGQIRLEGFFDEEFEKISEDELEQQLELSRRRKVGSFELEKAFVEQNSEFVETASQTSIDETYAPEKETPVIHDVIDYNSKNDERAIYLELEQLNNRFKLRTTLSFIALLAAAVVGLFGSGLLSEFGLGTAGEKAYIIVNTILLVFMIGVNFRAVFKGLKALFVLKPSEDSLTALACFVTLAHCAAAFLLADSSVGVSHLYVGVVGFMLLLNCMGKKSMMRRIFRNFRFIKDGDKYSSACITDPKQVKEFSKGIEDSYQDIRFNAKTEFPTRFLANSYADDPADTIARYAAFPVIGAALIIGIVSYFISKDWLSALSSLTAALLAGVPVAAMLSFHKALENADRELLRERGTITGFAAVDDAAGTTAVVLQADDLFPRSYCRLKGMKLFKKMQMDEAILYATSVLRHTHFPVRFEFMESTGEVEDKIPTASDISFESRLGVSAWIYERKVLLGTEQMMEAHGIEIPKNAKPEEFNRDNTRVLFMAMDGAVYAMFVCEYFSEPTAEFELQRLEGTGVELLIKTEDPNIDEMLLNEIFEIDPNSVKVLSMLAGSMFDEKLSRSVFNEAKIVNRGDPITFIRSITAASVLSSQFRLLKALHYASIVIGLLIIAVVSCFNSIASIGPLHIVGFGVFQAFITFLIPRINKAVPKR